MIWKKKNFMISSIFIFKIPPISFHSVKLTSKNMQNFTEYIKILKVVKYSTTRNKDLINLVDGAIYYCASTKPSLFNNNNHQLIEVDALYRTLYENLNHETESLAKPEWVENKLQKVESIVSLCLSFSEILYNSHPCSKTSSQWMREKRKYLRLSHEHLFFAPSRYF